VLVLVVEVGMIPGNAEDDGMSEEDTDDTRRRHPAPAKDHGRQPVLFGVAMVVGAALN